MKDHVLEEQSCLSGSLPWSQGNEHGHYQHKQNISSRRTRRGLAFRTRCVFHPDQECLAFKIPSRCTERDLNLMRGPESVFSSVIGPAQTHQPPLPASQAGNQWLGLIHRAARASLHQSLNMAIRVTLFQNIRTHNTLLNSQSVIRVRGLNTACLSGTNMTLFLKPHYRLWCDVMAYKKRYLFSLYVKYTGTHLFSA